MMDADVVREMDEWMDGEGEEVSAKNESNTSKYVRKR